MRIKVRNKLEAEIDVVYCINALIFCIVIMPYDSPKQIILEFDKFVALIWAAIAAQEN